MVELSLNHPAAATTLFGHVIARFRGGLSSSDQDFFFGQAGLEFALGAIGAARTLFPEVSAIVRLGVISRDRWLENGQFSQHDPIEHCVLLLESESFDLLGSDAFSRWIESFFDADGEFSSFDLTEFSISELSAHLRALHLPPPDTGQVQLVTTGLLQSARELGLKA